MSDFFAGPLPGQLPTAPASYPAPQWQGQPTPIYRPAGSPSPGWPTYTGGSGLSGGALAAVIVAVVVSAFIVVGILTAIAIPVFLNQRVKAEAAATTVVVPEAIGDLTRLHDAKSLQLEQQLRTQPGDPAVGIFGVDGAVRASVAITKSRMTDADETAFLAGAERSFQNQGVGAVVFTTVDGGRLAGKVRCATVVSPRFSTCVFADHGAFGSVSLYGTLAGRNDTALQIREAVEHRS